MSTPGALPARRIPFAIARALSLGAVLLCHRADAAEPPDSPQLEVVFVCTSCGLDADTVRTAVQSETRMVRGAGPGGTLRLEVNGRRLVARYEAPGRPALARAMTLPQEDEKAVQAIALLAANLVRDEAAELLDAMRKPVSAEPDVPPPPPEPTPASSTVRPAPAAASAPSPRPPSRKAPTPGAQVGAADSYPLGRIQVLAWGSTTMPGNLGLRYLYGYVYALLGAGWQPADSRFGGDGVARVGWQVGLGGHVPVSAFFLDLDLGYVHEGAASQPSDIEHSHVARARGMAGWQATRAFGVFAGGGLRREYPAGGTSKTGAEALFGIQLF